jgi:omega-6 fatty acid desaturase (delta-12 desaturase)
LLRDILGVVALATLAVFTIPQIKNPYFYAISWCLYGFIQGLFGTGLWVLAHECGHGGFSPSQRLNDMIGWSIHSMLLTPYFSWKSTHRRHHMYANHMERDHHYVPYRRDAYAAKLGADKSKLEDLAADTPVATTLRIIIQQVFG